MTGTNDQPTSGGWVTQEPTDDGVRIVAITEHGANSVDVPGGLTEDDLLD